MISNNELDDLNDLFNISTDISLPTAQSGTQELDASEIEIAAFTQSGDDMLQFSLDSQSAMMDLMNAVHDVQPFTLQPNAFFFKSAADISERSIRHILNRLLPSIMNEETKSTKKKKYSRCPIILDLKEITLPSENDIQQAIDKTIALRSYHLYKTHQFLHPHPHVASHFHDVTNSLISSIKNVVEHPCIPPSQNIPHDVLQHPTSPIPTNFTSPPAVVTLTVSVYASQCSSLLLRLQCPSTTPLSSIRDQLQCPADTNLLGSSYAHQCLLFMCGKVLLDVRGNTGDKPFTGGALRAIQLRAPELLKSKIRLDPSKLKDRSRENALVFHNDSIESSCVPLPLHETSFADLGCVPSTVENPIACLGLLLHQGDCEHLIVVEQACLDSQCGSNSLSNKSATDVHIIHRAKVHRSLKLCECCERKIAELVILGDIALPKSPCFCCSHCLQSIHSADYDELEKDPNVKIFPFEKKF